MMRFVTFILLLALGQQSSCSFPQFYQQDKDDDSLPASPGGDRAGLVGPGTAIDREGPMRAGSTETGNPLVLDQTFAGSTETGNPLRFDEHSAAFTEHVTADQREEVVQAVASGTNTLVVLLTALGDEAPPGTELKVERVGVLTQDPADTRALPLLETEVALPALHGGKTALVAAGSLEPGTYRGLVVGLVGAETAGSTPEAPLAGKSTVELRGDLYLNPEQSCLVRLSLEAAAATKGTAALAASLRVDTVVTYEDRTFVLQFQNREPPAGPGAGDQSADNPAGDESADDDAPVCDPSLPCCQTDGSLAEPDDICKGAAYFKTRYTCEGTVGGCGGRVVKVVSGPACSGTSPLCPEGPSISHREYKLDADCRSPSLACVEGDAEC